MRETALHDFFDPPLSSYNYSNAAIGQRATDLLLRLMAGEPPAGLSEVIAAEFLDRGSQFLR